jgi:hypothetical protein
MTVGSAENLAKIAQQQKHKKATNSSDGISTKAATFWDSNKVGRGGSETRELRRNEVYLFLEFYGLIKHPI